MAQKETLFALVAFVPCLLFFVCRHSISLMTLSQAYDNVEEHLITVAVHSDMSVPTRLDSFIWGTGITFVVGNQEGRKN